MKFELERLSNGATYDEIKNEVIRAANLISDAVISKKKFDSLSKISSSTLTKKFGSWEQVLIEFGLENRYSGRTVSIKMKNQVAKKLLDSELISELKKIAKKLDKDELSQTDFNKNSGLSASSICRRFGSWKEALKMAGLQEVKMAKRYTLEDYFENLLLVWTHYGRQPYYREMDSPPSGISVGAYEKRWGKWSSALKAFIDFMDNDNSTFKEELNYEHKIVTKTERIKQINRRDIPLGLRYKVLSRDRFRCVKCGSSPALDLACKLHLDHIIPFSKGGLTTLENLQTTCSSCNLGKGNRYVD
ncbi:homing endonuclease associated repeat-containing protein [Flavobacterium aurantiibacter]|uniref:HNH nuclease domain-containing protein n=1 Tax=Flavobacterium aurantiibacter TaxID=2023067 RepID=A0A255ZDN9_9FLAO|nr:HNH endonuclease [Flavobacterium aurantiibacter]OYQ39552.1 hypothetical protein CHX27_14230 [Flavobacterium aurantiibacter]